jgi:hypothetical protein
MGRYGRSRGRVADARNAPTRFAAGTMRGDGGDDVE